MSLTVGGIKKRTKKAFDVIYVQDFNDDYHKSNDSFDTLLLKAKGLKSQYTNIMDFREAKEIYEEYMKYLIDLNGGKKRYKILKKNKKIKQYIPIKPELKETTAIRYFLKYGVLSKGFLGRTSPYIRKVQADAAYEMLQSEFADEMEAAGLKMEDLDYDIEYSIDTTDFEDLLAIKQFELRKNDSMYRNRQYRSGSDSDLTADLFKRRHDKVQNKRDKFNLDELRIPSLTKMLSDDFNPDEWFITEAEYRGTGSEFVNVNGRYLRQEQADAYALGRQFAKYGLDLEEISANKPSYMAEYGQDSSVLQALANYKRMTKKEQKETRKRNKKRAKKHADLARESTMAVIQQELGLSIESYEEYKDMMFHLSQNS